MSRANFRDYAISWCLGYTVADAAINVLGLLLK